MLTLKSLAEAEKFVSRQKRLGNDVRWDGWNIIFFRTAPQGVYSKDGAFRGGQWGFENKVAVDEGGNWNVDWRDVRRANRNRN